jgi:hypothetical protein
MPDKVKTSSSARLGVVLFALAALMSFGVGLTLAAPPFAATIAVDDITELTVTVSGTADSPSSAEHHMVIDWGDGNEAVLPNFSTDAPWSWGPVDHTYAEEGTYTITATLIHSSENGNDRGTAAASEEVTIPGPCTEDCPTDDGTTDDGTTDDGTTDGTVQTPPETQVQGKTVTKKPIVKSLAKTGPETTGMTVLGLMLVMAGATIRLLTTREDEAAIAASTR